MYRLIDQQPAPRAQKSSQLNRGIGLVAAAGEVFVAAAMMVTVDEDEDIDGTEDRRSNVSHLAVGGAAIAGCCWKFPRCETGPRRPGLAGIGRRRVLGTDGVQR
jgi:hypothetical protein